MPVTGHLHVADCDFRFNEAPAGGRGMHLFHFINTRIYYASMRPRLEAGECFVGVFANPKPVVSFNEAPAGGRGMRGTA